MISDFDRPSRQVLDQLTFLGYVPISVTSQPSLRDSNPLVAHRISAEDLVIAEIRVVRPPELPQRLKIRPEPAASSQRCSGRSQVRPINSADAVQGTGFPLFLERFQKADLRCSVAPERPDEAEPQTWPSTVVAA